MIDFIEYVVAELKSKRLSKANAAELVRQFSVCRASSSAEAVIHPLLHSNTSDLAEQRYSSIFTGEEFFLAEHQVKISERMVQRILPGVAYLEMARAAVEQASPGRRESTVLELRNTAWAQPIIVNGSKQVNIALFPNDGNKIEYEIYSQSGEQEIIHCQGLAIRTPQTGPRRLDIEHLKRQMTSGKVEPDGIYHVFARMGLMYGPAFQGITAIYQGKDQILAYLRLPRVVEGQSGDYVLHPSLMDSALQACIGLMHISSEYSSQPRLPFALESLRILSPCTCDMIAWLRYAKDSHADDHVVKLDIDLCDGQGNVCVAMRGFSSRILKNKEEKKRHLRQEIQPGLQSFAPVWNPVNPDTHKKTILPQLTKILMLGGDQAHLDWVQKTYPAAYMLPLPSTIQALEAELKGCSFDHLLWIAPDVARADIEPANDEDQIIEQQELGVMAVFRIMKALLRLGYGDKELQWTIITSKTQRVKKDDRIQPTHAGISGLIGSVAKEFSHWDLNLLDVDSLASLAADECLSITQDKRGNGLARRKDEWFRQEFAYIPVLEQLSPVPYRQKGVYLVIGGAGGLGEVWTRFMIERYQATVVWIGRHECNTAIEDKISSLARVGPAPLYISADATKLDALEQAFKTILKIYPAIHGVVHSAIVLHDQGIARMEESEFRASLSAKVDISVNIDRVFGKQELDFILFFSSVMSFVKGPGQSNYAAGCTFKDSFAQKLQQQRAYPIKTMNWGYWGEVGIVADEHHKKTMESMGIGSIEPNEGMECLQAFVCSGLNQVGLIKMSGAHTIADFTFAESLTCYPKVSMMEPLQLPGNLAAKISTRQLEAVAERLEATALEGLLAEILASTLVSLGVLKSGLRQFADLPVDKQPAKFYERWLSSSIHYLQEQKMLGSDLKAAAGARTLDDLWAEWEARKSMWTGHPGLQAQIRLLEICLKALPDILKGKQAATDVIFPRSSMQLVEGVYRDNATADYFNEVLGETLSAYVEHMLRVDKQHKVRILEIGAGTGGTTAKLIPVLQRLPIEEYSYTDVSRAFLIHAEEQYGPKFPALITAAFDVSRPLALQSIAADHYDVVVAANILHATPNIRETLRNAKATLKNQGILLLNEISTWSLFAHLTFGLLEGWWLSEDTALRLPGSPGLTPERWREILVEEGFESVSFPAQDAHKFGQQIIVGSSDGWVRQRLNKQPTVVPERKHSVPAITMPAKAVSGDEESLRKKALFYFQKLVASTLKMRHDQFDPRRPLAEYGLDSILVGQLTYQLRKAFSDITTTLFFEVQSIDGLVDYFLQNRKQELATVLSMSADAPQPLPATQDVPKAALVQGECRPRGFRRASARHIAQEQKISAGASIQQALPAERNSAALAASIFDVAVIGLSGRYPQSKNLKEFWKNLSNGVNCITEIPRDRWNWEIYYDSQRGKAGKIYTKWGGFIEGIDQFDPLFFKISPTEAKRMDPQERVFLECCYHAIEDAGYTPENLGASEKIGIFAGVMNSRYTPQPVHSSIANRVSYLFNFQGPSMAVDTACSASLTAIHVALESIYSGLSECAIAGGVNLIIDPVHYLQLTDMTVLSSGKQCKAFGAQADGFVDAEGVGAVVLKPLKQAELDGDHIYAVIKGSAINAGGRTNGYTVPNPKAQAKVVARALERANVKAEQLSYIEAHGTGTALGDPIEIAGLTRAFKGTDDKKQYCSIGSVKSNIGHCESAAGIAGLTKVLLQLKYEQLAPSLHSDIPNPEISFEQTPFKIQKNLENWRRPLCEVNGVMQEMPRIAGISSFGAGGANAHVVVQEYAGPEKGGKPGVFAENSKIIIVLSARNAEQLKQKASDLLSFIGEEGQAAIASGKAIDLAGMAYTLHVGREAMEERLGFLVKSVKQLAEKLQAYVAGEHSIEDVYRGQVKRNQETLSLFSTDDDLQQTVDKWIADRKVSKLLELWVKGLEVDWSKLYGECKPQRISLPTYPFARERYWVERAVEGQGTAATAILHPLLHRNTSDLSEQRYSSTFTGDEFFLADHIVKTNGHAGQKVLPGVAYLEMARAAMEQALPASQESAVLELRNIVWAQPMVVSENQQINIALWMNDSNEVDFEIYSQNVDQEIVYCQGCAVWIHQAAPAKLDIQQLKETMGQGKLERESVYAAFAGMGLVYGPSFQALAAVHRGSGHVLAQLRLPPTVEDALRDYVLHPSMMDGALQAAIGLLEKGQEPNQPQLPFALERLRIVSPCSRDMIAWVRYAPGSHTGDKVVKLDVDLCDESGNACVQIHGLSSRVLTQEIGTSAAQGDSIGNLLATPVWQVMDARESGGENHIEYSERHLILCELSKANVRKLESLMVPSHCLSLQAEREKNIAQRYSDYALVCFERTRTILQSRPQSRVLIQIVVADHEEQVLLAGLSGLLKTAALENPHLIGQLLLVPHEVTTEELARQLQAEMLHSSDQLVRYEQGVRQVMQWEQIVNDPGTPPVAFKDHGVYLITGGLGGLGILFAKEILKQTRQATIVLTGRSASSAEQQALLDELSSSGGRVSYRQMDLGNLNEVRQLIASIQEEYGQLKGILHSAGMIADSFILKKTSAEFTEVLGPKVTGTYHLDQASQNLELDFFVLFSSVAGALGNVGQADYAAANGFMDQFAAYRNLLVAAKQRHGRTRSINWAAWQAGGMTTDVATRAMLEEATGMRPMQTATGMQAFYRSLMLPNDQVLVAEGDLSRLRRALAAGWRAPSESQTNNSEISGDMDSESLAAKTQDYLRREFSELLQLPYHKIDPQAPLENYGIDSILAMKLTNKLEKRFGPLSKTLFFEYQTITGLAGYFLKAHPAVLREQVGIQHQASSAKNIATTTEKKRSSIPARRSNTRSAEVKTNDRKEIAIIGLAGRYPQAANLLEFWKNLQNGRDCITEIPLERWDYKLYYDPGPNKSGKSYTKWGGFIADVDKFDPLFFNISPREAALIDPQERLFLETAWETIEDAGYTKASISGSRIGVFVGVMWGQYELFGVDSILSGDAAIPSSSYASIANRVSYFFDFHGPSIALDTMCSSSLTAIHLACEELRKGDIDAAIAGGVNVTIHPSKYLTLSQGKFGASDGKCRSFGEGGDGYVPGEGVGAVLLKPLEKALRDGDQIYAVVKSSALNHGGKTNGYTVPNPNAQGDLVLNALKQANIDPKTLGYIETHGTGTSLGDPIEITGLLKAFEGSAAEKQFCPIGSVKSNIGHLESAAGIAAITKALLQIKYKQLVPSLHADPPNPNINFKESPFYVHTQLTEWDHAAAHPRRVGVSSFGAGGSNAHFILEEYFDAREPERMSHRMSPEAFVLSARDWEAIRRYAEKIVVFLENVPDISLANMAYTSQVGRTPMDVRLAVIASSVEDLRDKLNQWIALSKNAEIRSGAVPELDNVFSGNIRETQYSAKDLIEGRAGKAFLADLLENNNLEKLARFWVVGVEIDWALLGRDATPRKISLPTYPFAKERCWVTINQNAPALQKKALHARQVAAPGHAQEKRRTYYYPHWTLQPVAVSGEDCPVIGSILMLDTSDDLFLTMKEQPENGPGAGSIVLVKPGKSFQEIGPNIYVIDPERQEQFQELIEHLRSKALLPQVVLHHCSDVCDLVKEEITQHMNNGLYALFYLSKALMKEKHQGPLRFLSVFSSHSELATPLGAAVGGFLKTLALENPQYLVKTVEVPREPESSLSKKAGLIWKEIYEKHWTAKEIRYGGSPEREQQRYTRYISELTSHTPVESRLSALPLKQNGIYLVSGGLGGLGLIFAEYLAKHFQSKLVLFGRSAPNANQQEKLHHLRTYGAETLVLQADVSKLEDMERVVREAKARFPEINGVIHAAGMNRDSFIFNKTKEEMEMVLAPKVYGTINLDLATSSENLDFFVLFSSIAGIFGNPGQSDYAYGNHFLDSFAETREDLRRAEKRSGRTLSINWPLWEEGGMGISQDAVSLMKQQTGICPLTTQDGIRYWEDFLRSETLQGIALYGVPSRIASFIAQKPARSDKDVAVQTAGVDAAILFAKTEEYLKALIGEEIKLAPDRIGSSDRLESFGIDSVMIHRLNTSLERDLGALPKTLLYQHETVQELAQFLLKEARNALVKLFGLAGSAGESTNLPAAPAEIEEADVQDGMPSADAPHDLGPIAIIGIHGYYPHSANLAEYWKNLKEGKDLIDLVPPNRWNYEEFYHPDPAAAADGKIYCKWGGFLDDYDKFDPQFFKISTAEARIIDPQERLFMQSVWAAIEDAGYTRESLKKRCPKARSADVGVFVGVTTNSYHLWGPEERSRGNNACPSALPWSVANRVSYFFNFNGPSLPVDTACSSSLVAVHLACESLKNRECQVAIAGGVNLYLHPSKYQSLCQRRMLSLDGKCHSYGAGNDGFVPGEGVGTLVLKPLSKAIEHQDHIYAIIPASAYDHSGRSNGYSAPNPNSQANLISHTLKKAHIHPETIGYVEGHGTGTQLGDGIEIAALSQAFETQTTKKQFCPIGSVKANIGHSESAAGVAGIAKVILQLKHQQLAPSIHSEEVNPNIELKNSPFYLQHELSDWKSSPALPRRALINSFGAGGVNACVVLQEYQEPGSPHNFQEAGPRLFALSARNEHRLGEYVHSLLVHLRSEQHVDLAGLCYTLQVGREAMENRLAIVASEVTGLIDRLDEWSKRGSAADVYHGNIGPHHERAELAKAAGQSLTEIASKWVAGEEIDWDSLYPGAKPRRISLPTYPFLRERYWVSNSLVTEKRTLSVAQLHPLISYNSSTLKEVSFSSSLSDTAFYALDHKVNDEGIFPGAGFLEMACISGSIAAERRVRKIADIVWIRPLSFREGAQTARTFLKCAGDIVEYVVSSLDDENETVLHSEGKLAFSSDWTAPADGKYSLPIETLKAQCARCVDGSAYYGRFGKYGLNYGPSFQTIQEIYINDLFALSRLKLPDQLKNDFGQFILHPSMIDGALQTAVGLLAGRESASLHLPFALDELDILHPVRQTCYAYAEFASSRQQDHADIQKFNIRLLNESGDVLINFRNLIVRALPMAQISLSADTARLAVAGDD